MWLARRKFCAAGAAVALAPYPLFAQRQSGERRAVLIGVCDYQKFPNRRLEGPANDVLRVRALLQSRGFSDIEVVADRLGASVPLPTRANIVSAFNAMSERISGGDFLFLYFAGHGAQQPVINPKREELDGVDEVLLPSDAGRLSEFLTIQNAIVDDDIGAFISACRKRGATVWAVVDACHAGDSTRDAPLPTGATARGLTTLDLGFPKWVQQLVDRFPASQRTARLGQINLCGDGATQLAGGMLGFFACRSDQRTIELPVSQNQAGRRVSGLFTHVLLTHLAAPDAERSATYLDLVKHMERTYAQDWQGWNWQPQFCADPASEIATRGIFT